MKIDSLAVKHLYNCYTYDIDFTNISNKICILTGPNGYGKTTVLQIINSLAIPDLFYFCTFPFESIKVRFDNGESLEILTSYAETDSEDEASDVENLPSVVNFIYSDKKSNKLSSYQLSLEIILKAVPDIQQNNSDFSFSRKTIKSIWQAIKNVPNIYERIAHLQKQPSFLFWLKRICVSFVPAQRLNYIEQDYYDRFHSKRRNEKKSSIDEVVLKLKKTLEQAQLSYFLVAQKHDNNFIHKLLSSSNKEYDATTYKEKAEILQRRLDEILSFNMIEPMTILPYEESHKSILSAYIDDCAEKLDSYNQIVAKLRIFSEIIEKKEFPNKRIFFSPKIGLNASSVDGKHIDINDLSSGEQNEIIMLYHFIFESKDDSILLIDEPEISLHVAWQLDFISDIEKIANEKKMQIIIASHSPQIINNRWQNCFDFYEHNSVR